MLSLNETLDKLAKANKMQWCGHVLRRETDDVRREAMQYEVAGKRKREQPERTWRKQMEEEIVKIGLKKEEAYDRARR